MSKEKQNILVAGANGTTGRIIIDLLQNSNKYRPVAMVRKQAQKDHFAEKNVATVLADLEEDVSHAFNDRDKVIFAAGSGGKKVVEVDQEGAKRLIDAAKNAGTEKFVMLSSMGADDPSQASELEAYLKAKHNADEYLRESGLNFTIVRPGQLTNNEGTGKIQLDTKLGKNGKISRADVAQTLVDALPSEIKQNQTFEILAGEQPIEEAVS